MLLPPRFGCPLHQTPVCNRFNIFFGYVFFFRSSWRITTSAYMCECVFWGAVIDVVAIEKYKMKFPLYFSRISFDSIRMHFNNAITLFIDGCQTTKQVHDFTVAAARTPFRHSRCALSCVCVCAFLGRILRKQRRAYTNIFACLLSKPVYTPPKLNLTYNFLLSVSIFNTRTALCRYECYVIRIDGGKFGFSCIATQFDIKMSGIQSFNAVHIR